jgi:translation initiation factor 2 subunit 2
MSDPVDSLADKVSDIEEEDLDLSIKKKKKKKAAPSQPVESSTNDESTEPKTDSTEDTTAAPAKKKVIKIIKKVIKKVPVGSSTATSTPSDSTAAPSASAASGAAPVKKIVKKVVVSSASAATEDKKKVLKKPAEKPADAPAPAAPAKKKVVKKSVKFDDDTSIKAEKEDPNDFYSQHSKAVQTSSRKKSDDWFKDEDEEGNDDEEAKQDNDEENEDAADDDDDDDLNFSKMKKKKKKSVATDDNEHSAKNEEAADEDDGGISFGDFENKSASEDNVFKETWLETDREYRYEELLGRIYHLMSEFNPDMIKSKNRYVIRPPQVFRDGTKKSVWANFPDICNEMHRPIDHVLAYSKAELGTTASIDGNNRMVIKGRFQPRQIESVVRHYIAEYVSCRTCKSPETILKKENRLHFMQCKSCGSTRSVAPIKAGFQAQIGHRIKT